MGSSLVVQWLGLGAFTAEGPGSIWLGNEDPTSRRALPKKKRKERKEEKKKHYGYRIAIKARRMGLCLSQSGSASGTCCEGWWLMAIPPHSPGYCIMGRDHTDPGAATKNVHHVAGESLTPKRPLWVGVRTCSVATLWTVRWGQKGDDGHLSRCQNLLIMTED